jgi:hypothetical protein
VPDGGDPADRLSGGGAHEVRRCAAHALHADQLRDLGGVHPVGAGRQHEQRFAVGVEDQRVRDLADLDAKRGRGCRGGGDGVRQHPQSRHPGRVGPARGEGGDHEVDVAVGRGAHLSIRPRHQGSLSSPFTRRPGSR